MGLKNFSMKKKKKVKSKKRHKLWPPQKFRTFVENTVDEIKEEHGLKDFEIKYAFATKPTPVDDDGVPKTTAATIHIDPKYLDALITVYPIMVDLWKDNSQNRIREILCHEIAHIRTDKMVRLARERYVNCEDIDTYWETLTEIVGRLMFNVIHYKKYARKNKK